MNLYLLVEGDPDENALRKIITLYNPRLEISSCLGKRGKSYIESRILELNRSAHVVPFLVLVDLNGKIDCAPILVNQWLPHPAKYMWLRVAVRELEAWLLADRINFASFLSIPESRIPLNPESVNDPKELVINLARRSRRREIVEDIVPPHNSTSRVGRNYNGKISEYIQNYWNVDEARKRSLSLDKIIRVIENIS